MKTFPQKSLEEVKIRPKMVKKTQILTFLEAQRCSDYRCAISQFYSVKIVMKAHLLGCSKTREFLLVSNHQKLPLFKPEEWNGHELISLLLPGKKLPEPGFNLCLNKISPYFESLRWWAYNEAHVPLLPSRRRRSSEITHFWLISTTKKILIPRVQEFPTLLLWWIF